MLRLFIIQYRAILLISFILISAEDIKCQGFDFKGQLSSWGMGSNLQNDLNGYFGIRYIPQFNYSYQVDEHNLLNTEVLFNTYYSTDLNSHDYAFKFYRAIFRYTTAQTETQIGLQKINFGPAQLLRPLMWFDSVDPRDPLKLTDGVYAVRYKYNFIDNSNFWLWCLYGNRDTKGYEIYRTADKTPEFGGRLQLPVPAGEIAATFHTRKADEGIFDYRENRYAFDGRWDIGIGIWLESVLQQNISDSPIYKWNKMTAIGGDYTIPIENGIYILAEHMFSNASNSTWNTNNNRQVSALMMTYPIGVLDVLTLQEYYSWQDKNLYQFYQWQRTYDSFIINAALFHYPENGAPLFSQFKTAPASGYGVELMLIYNY